MGSQTILITGFEPFGGSTLNPSQCIAESIVSRLGDWAVAARVSLKTALLPVDTERIGAVVDGLWAEHDPDIVLHFGESAAAEHLTLERVALNLLDFDRPDNAGRQLFDRPIDVYGPAARFSTLPIRALADRLEEVGVETRLSLSAGAYLCNQALYLSLGHAERRGGRAVGFVHVPSLVEQVERGERSGAGLKAEVLLDQASALVQAVVGLADRADAG